MTSSLRYDVWGTSAEIPCWWPFTLQIWVELLVGRLAREFAATNKKHFPDLGGDTSPVWNFCAAFFRRHFAGKTERVVALRKVGWIVRPQNNSHVSLVRIIVAEVTLGLSFCFIISGNSADAVNNPACIGKYSFIQFIASAVCHRNPLKSGRYLGIKITRRDFLTLCEVEVYSRGNGLTL